MDPYAILGVTKNSTQEEIKDAYRKLAKKLHPDLNPGNKSLEAKFKDLASAYEKIATTEERAKFDRGEVEREQHEKSRAQASREPFYYETQGPGSRYSSGSQGFDPDLFAELFGQKGFNRAARGVDQQYSMEVDFVTGVLGGEREITLPGGKKLHVKIPAGIKSGTKLRLATQNANVPPQAPASDIFIEITVLDSPVFKRSGNDIEVNLALSIVEAMLGAEVRVPTVDGPVMLKIPKGLTSGSRVRIKGKGVPGRDGRGDQYAVVTIAMPPAVDPELENFMLEWAKKNAYDPRKGAV